ncbi:hypothetical protein [Amycolatopsis sp. CA-126428]|uniref:hypothetical protein n=1 Tax=Amycolatopsis sp. CA-126428 TaxID=2073158 RepID=UPI001304F4BB|nr:hypothetical protein [Amycolatopsis sp. CA-126428]
MHSLRIVALLLLFRLFLLDLGNAHDGWSWIAVIADVVLGLIIWGEREPAPRTGQDVRR